MVILWLVGDVLKLIYYIIADQPIQFIICAIVQITVEIAILLQFCIYAKSKDSYSRLADHTENVKSQPRNS